MFKFVVLACKAIEWKTALRMNLSRQTLCALKQSDNSFLFSSCQYRGLMHARPVYGVTKDNYQEILDALREQDGYIAFFNEKTRRYQLHSLRDSKVLTRGRYKYYSDALYVSLIPKNLKQIDF